MVVSYGSVTLGSDINVLPKKRLQFLNDFAIFVTHIFRDTDHLRNLNHSPMQSGGTGP